MDGKTRRSFLAAIGATAFAGCATEASNNDTTTAGGGSDSSTTAGTTPAGTTAKNTTTANETTATTTSKSPAERGEAVEAFEQFENWVKIDQYGSIGTDDQDVYKGSQSVRLKAGKSDNYVGMRKAAGRGGWDFSGKNFSMAVKVAKPQVSKVTLELYAPDRGHPITMTRTLAGPWNRWTRIDFGVTSTERDPDLSNVQEIRVVGRSRGSDQALEFLVDDLRVVDRPKKGYVLLTFDDSRVSQYTKAFPMLQKYGFPGTVGVIPSAVYKDGFLDDSQMREMRDAGWDMAAHAGGSMSMPEYSKEEQEQLMLDANDFLQNNGFMREAKHFITPKNLMGPNTYDLVQKHYDTAFRFGHAPNGMPATDPHNFGRIDGEAIDAAKNVVSQAAHYKQAAVVMFHRIGDGGNGFISEPDLQSILDHIEGQDVEVITPTELLKKQESL